jgi:hypothetical protein
VTEPNKYAELAQRLAKAERGWLPGVGQVVNITFDEFEAMMVLNALTDAALLAQSKTPGSVT